MLDDFKIFNQLKDQRLKEEKERKQKEKEEVEILLETNRVAPHEMNLEEALDFALYGKEPTSSSPKPICQSQEITSQKGFLEKPENSIARTELSPGVKKK